MGLGYCSKVVSTVYASPDLPSCRRHQKAPLPVAAMAKQATDMPAEGIVNWVQQCKFGRHTQHTAASYVDGTGAFPHSGLLFNCVTGEHKGQTAASDHRS